MLRQVASILRWWFDPPAAYASGLCFLPFRTLFHNRVKIPESSIAVYMSSKDKDVFIIFLNESFFNLFLIVAPHKAQVDVATNAVNAKVTANNAR